MGRGMLAVAITVGLLVGAAACADATDQTPRSSTTRGAVAGTDPVTGLAPDRAVGDRCAVTPATELPAAHEVEGSIRVLAAASLTEAFADLADAFETVYPDADVAVSFGASSDLVARLHQGAPADVLATADTATMADAATSGDVGTPATFACNAMVILTGKGNPVGITDLADLARPDVRFTLCAEPVPCGRLGRAVLDRAGVDAEPVGFEANVKAVVAKVTAGEVDAGIVYVTDAQMAAATASSVAIPDDVNVTTAYPVAVTSDADDPATGATFSEFVRSSTGRAILVAHGFGAG